MNWYCMSWQWRVSWWFVTTIIEGIMFRCESLHYDCEDVFAHEMAYHTIHKLYGLLYDMYFVTIHELILYVLAVTSFMVICNHNYWRNNVSFVKAYIMIGKMSLHMKWLITLFTSCMVYFMICFIVVFEDYHLSEVFGTYLT